MAYKTILVHLADDQGHMARLRLALELTARFKAHLVALYIANPISMPAAIAGRGASLGYIGEATEVAREKAVAVQAEISTPCKRRNLSWEWRMDEGDHLDILARHAHLADLAIVSHSRAELIEDRVMFHVPEHLPLVVGCPVIVLPESGDVGALGKNVMVAWRGSREALRAMRDALPFLKKAGKVTLLSACPAEHDVQPGERAAAFLARHGVKAEFRTDIHGSRHVGEVILAHARDLEADLLVMGGYGHSLLREMVLGGVTRHVLNHTPVPVLMSH